MTPTERNEDQQLAKTLRMLAKQVAKRSKRMSVTMIQAAERILALSTAQPITHDDPTRNTPFASPSAKQPASAPDKPPLDPVRD